MKAIVKLSDFQKLVLKEFTKKIQTGDLKLVNNNCICGNKHKENDIIVSEKDRYGIKINQVLCSNCGIIRSEKIFDSESNKEFYEKYYRDIYVGKSIPDQEFFTEQRKRGNQLLNILKKEKIFDKVNLIMEIGCGAGGILYPFMKEEKNVTGFDFNDNYLKYGRDKGLNLIKGDYYLNTENQSFDLIVLSHVLEHFTNPISELIKISEKLKIGKFLLIEVPGILTINRYYMKIFEYFQTAHVYNFCLVHLKCLFEKLGYEFIYGNERCTVVVKKIKEVENPEEIYCEYLNKYPKRIFRYLAFEYVKEKLYLNINYWKRKIKKVIKG